MIRKLVLCVMSIILLVPCAYAADCIRNPNWYICISDGGYSDWMISPHGHEQLSGEWGAAILYDGIATGGAMWLEKYWICPNWQSNSQFLVIEPFTGWDDPANPIVGKDTGRGVINNGDVEITITCSMVDGYTVMGLTPGVETINRVTSYRYVMLQTYTIRNMKDEDITNLSFFQLLHPHPNDDYGPNNYGVYDPTDYADPHDNFSEFVYDMTFFAPYSSWSPYLDDVVGFSTSLQPTAYAIGKFPGHLGEPGPGSLHHEVEADNLNGVNYLGPEEIAGAMKWYLGTVRPGEEVSVTVLFSTSHSDTGLPPQPVPEPTVIYYTGDTWGYQGENVTLSAQLTDQNGDPLPHKVISFLLGGQSANAVTDGFGFATTPLLLDQCPGNYMVTASFLGDNEYGGSLDSQPFEILAPSYISVDLDIKPQSCPNPFNMGSKGVLPVAILGTTDFDVSTIDPLTVRLEGVAPLRWNYEDVATPVVEPNDSCECTTLGPDGYTDMTLKFDHQTIAASLGTAQDREIRTLTLTGTTYDGMPIIGKDCVIILRKARVNLSREATAAAFSLGDAYPNPFNRETEISFSIPEMAQVSLVIYDVLGKKVKTLVNEEMPSGTKTVSWKGTDEYGNPVASGIYFYKLSAGDFTATKKVVLTD